MLRKRGILPVVVAVVFAVAMVAPTPVQAADTTASQVPASIAGERVGPSSLTIEPHLGYQKATLTVVGPNGYELSKNFGPEAEIHVNLLKARRQAPEVSTDGDLAGGPAALKVASTLEEGQYRYEVVFHGQDEEVQTFSGMFFAKNGVALSRGELRSRLVSTRTDLSSENQRSAAATKATEDDWLTVVDITNDGETFFSLDCDGVVDNSYWVMTNDEGTLHLGDNTTFSPPATQNVTFTRDGKVGIGTTAPVDDLHVKQLGAGVASFRTEDDSGDYFQIDTGSGATAFRDFNAGGTVSTPMWWDHGLPSWMLTFDSAGGGRLGMGTSNPQAALELRRSDGTAKIFVNENNATVDKRELFVLENVGAPQFKFIDSDSAREWQFALLTTSDFVISLIGTGGSEFQLYKNGRVTMGPGATINFDLETDGDLVIAGTLTQGSSRDIKTGISGLDAAGVLAKVATLPVSSWAYRADPDTMHVGPMAEDFHATFGLGSDSKHIAPADLAGVALAAVQALQLENQHLATENESLKARLDRLEGMISQLMN